MLALLIEQQMVVAEVRPADMPVEILGLEIKRKRRRQDGVELFGNLADGVRRQIGRRIEWRGGLAACVEGSDFAHGCHLGGWGWGNGASPAAPGAASSRRNVAGNLSFHVGRRGRERKASSLRIAP